MNTEQNTRGKVVGPSTIKSIWRRHRQNNEGLRAFARRMCAHEQLSWELPGVLADGWLHNKGIERPDRPRRQEQVKFARQVKASD